MTIITSCLQEMRLQNSLSMGGTCLKLYNRFCHNAIHFNVHTVFIYQAGDRIERYVFNEIVKFSLLNRELAF